MPVKWKISKDSKKKPKKGTYKSTPKQVKKYRIKKWQTLAKK
jgi:hypothetical protein